MLAGVMVLIFRVRVDLRGIVWFNVLVATLLLGSRMRWHEPEHHRLADALGTVAIAGLGGLVGGAVAMLELRLGFPIADGILRDVDLTVGADGIAIIEWQLKQGLWLFSLMAPAYNYTLHIFFLSMVLLAALGKRTEAWRAAMCFVGTLLTTCAVAAFVPAKGLAVWASPDLLLRLPEKAMRTFWAHFDDFYFSVDPVLRVQVIDGVVCFPSFHAIVGFLTFAMWRKSIWTCVPAGAYLVTMLLSTLPGGGHYVIDLIGGFAVWAAWFALSKHMERGIAAA